MTLPRLVKSSTASTDVKRIVCLTWRRLVQHLSLLQADGEAEVLGCIREAVEDVLYGFLRVGEKGAVVSKQQLSGDFLNGFVRARRRRRLKRPPLVRKRM